MYDPPSRRLPFPWLLTFLLTGSAFAQQAAPVGGRGGQRQALGPILSNRAPIDVRPAPRQPADATTFRDPQGRLEVVIDAAHGYLKSLRFPTLWEAAQTGSVDRYILLDGLPSSELDDQVIGVHSRLDGPTPHVIVDCLNHTSALAVRKIYQFDPAHGELLKTIEIDSPDEKLLTVASVSVLSEAAREGAYYYQYLTHTASRYVSFPAARIGDAYFLNRRNYQSGVMTVTRPDLDFTYGEVQLSTNGVPEYLCVQSDGYLPVTAGVETLLTRDGWQLPRGSFVQVGPGRQPQRIRWLYAAVRGTHLMWHAQYHRRYFAPAFAPERSLDKRIDLAFDTSFVWPHAAARYRDGRLELVEGDRELWRGGLTRRWEQEPLPLRDRDGNALWHQNLATFDAAHEMFETLDLDPRAWATCGIAETMYTMGDFLADHMWFAPSVPHKNEDFFDAKKVSMREYFRFVRKLQQRWPRFKLFNYERGTYYPQGDTIHRHPEFAFFPVPDGNRLRPVAYAPRWNHFFSQMTDKYLDLQKEGISLYVDWAIAAADARKRPDGRVVFQSYETGQRAVQRMARKLRAAGGFFFANQPSSPWADLGYIEGGSWDTDTRVDWRFWAERLQLYKLHEFRPNTVVALDMMCDEFIHQCLIYNLVPSTMNRVGVPTNQSWAPQELIRLRWYLREASMAPVPLRPVAWEEPDSPLETSVMTLPGGVYLAAYNHITQDHTADLSVDLGPVISTRPSAIWKADVSRGPWAGVVSPQGHEPHQKPTPDQYRIGYRYETAEVTFRPYHDVTWEGRKLQLPGVQVPQRQTTFFFLSMVPALVRSVEGKDVLWPLSSQPHLHIDRAPDGALRISSGYTRAVLAIDPSWLTADAATAGLDEKTGWPTVVVRPGTWRLRTDGRLLYESRRPPPDRDPPVAAPPPPLTTRGPVGTEQLAVDGRLVLQNGQGDYRGQVNEQLTTGQWGAETGYDSHGDATGQDTIFLYCDGEATRHARSLLRFDLRGQLPEGARLVRATLVIHCHKGINGSNLLAGYRARKPWTDGATYWTNWGQGGSDPGYTDPTALFKGAISRAADYHFRVPPAVVQSWLDRPETNHGLLLRAVRDSNAFHWMADGDSADAPPKLILEYHAGGD